MKQQRKATGQVWEIADKNGVKTALVRIVLRTKDLQLEPMGNLGLIFANVNLVQISKDMELTTSSFAPDNCEVNGQFCLDSGFETLLDVIPVSMEEIEMPFAFTYESSFAYITRGEIVLRKIERTFQQNGKDKLDVRFSLNFRPIVDSYVGNCDLRYHEAGKSFLEPTDFSTSYVSLLPKDRYEFYKQAVTPKKLRKS